MQHSLLNTFERHIYLLRRQRADKAITLCAAALFIAIASHATQAAEPVQIAMTADRWTTVVGDVTFIQHMGKSSIELKAGEYKKHIPPGVASLKDFQFGNGTIEYDVSAENGMGASFIFRAANKDTFEMFYLRPRPNCQEAPDCVQYAPQTHGVLLWDL